MSPDAYQSFPIEKIDKISHNTAIYRFKLPEGSVLGLPIGQHVSIAAELDVKDPKTEVVERKEVARSYTPISSDINPGYFDLLVKSYPTGNISRHLATLKVGDTMKVKGPKGNMIYTPNMVRHFGMVAGGTGITPMLQIISAVERGRNTGDKTEIDLLFANVNEEDILMRKELEEIAAKDKKIRVHYVLNNPPAGWKGEVGFVTGDMIKVSWEPFVDLLQPVHLTDSLRHRNTCPSLPRTSRSWFAARRRWFPRSRRLARPLATTRPDRYQSLTTSSSLSDHTMYV